MWLLMTFIIVWALSPGPVAVMTLNESRKSGAAAGVAIAAGATLTAALMVLAGLFVQAAGFLTLVESNNLAFVEQIGAGGIILMGLYAGYKSLWSASDGAAEASGSTGSGVRFLQGMMLMATYIPQALLYYNVILPQTVEVGAIYSSILLLGGLKVALIFVWHAGIAVMATKAQFWVKSHSMSRVLEFSLSCLIVAMGVNILM